MSRVSHAASVSHPNVSRYRWAASSLTTSMMHFIADSGGTIAARSWPFPSIVGLLRASILFSGVTALSGRPPTCSLIVFMLCAIGTESLKFFGSREYRVVSTLQAKSKVDQAEGGINRRVDGECCGAEESCVGRKLERD